VRERLEYPALKKRIVAEKQRWKAQTILIEDKGSGTSLLQDLRTTSVYCIAIKPEGDKVVRMSACSDRIESGSVLLPRRASWLDQFRAELLAFPHGSHDDQADALSQLINWTRKKTPTGNALEAQVPAGKLVHVIRENYAAHEHRKVIAWLAAGAASCIGLATAKAFAEAAPGRCVALGVIPPRGSATGP
jgi:predicted phage terminase large subunit-like protein